jgi:hypothetical protein
MHNPVQNAAKRSALLVHPYGHKVTGFKTDDDQKARSSSSGVRR